MTTPPNIILIMTDQQRVDTISAWGWPHMHTPALDRLAASSVSFRLAFAPGATCIASRAAMFTGMYAHNTGIYSFSPWERHRNWVQDLAAHGYWCASVGKMHFSPRDIPGGYHERVVVENPTNRDLYTTGSDDEWGRFLAHHGRIRPNERHRSDPDWIAKHQGVVWEDDERFHSDVFIGDAALAWIRNHQGTGPFFLQIGFTGPHEPYDPLPRDFALYRDAAVPAPVGVGEDLAQKPPQHKAHQQFHAEIDHESRLDLRTATEDEIVTMRRHYYAKVTTIDRKIEQILDALEARGWLDDSLVIFCSDHGDLLGDQSLPYKWLMYDPVVHVPLMIRPPGGRQAEIGELVSLIDLGPTVLDYAGVPLPEYLEGRSLRPQLEATGAYPREFVICEDNYQLMLRTQTHKLVYYLGQQEGELYDLTRDRHELVNLWDDPAQLEQRQRLTLLLLDWLATSSYLAAGYHFGQQSDYRMRWPGSGSAELHDGRAMMQPQAIRRQMEG